MGTRRRSRRWSGDHGEALVTREDAPRRDCTPARLSAGLSGSRVGPYAPVLARTVTDVRVRRNHRKGSRKLLHSHRRVATRGHPEPVLAPTVGWPKPLRSIAWTSSCQLVAPRLTAGGPAKLLRGRPRLVTHEHQFFRPQFFRERSRASLSISFRTNCAHRVTLHSSMRFRQSNENELESSEVLGRHGRNSTTSMIFMPYPAGYRRSVRSGRRGLALGRRSSRHLAAIPHRIPSSVSQGGWTPGSWFEPLTTPCCRATAVRHAAPAQESFSPSQSSGTALKS